MLAGFPADFPPPDAAPTLTLRPAPLGRTRHRSGAWGAEIRSCSSSVVVVEQPAELVAPAHRTWLALAGEVQASRRIRRPQLQRPVRTMDV
jgi:hypothetical protein